VAAVEAEFFQDPVLGPVDVLALGAVASLALAVAIRVAGRGAVSGTRFSRWVQCEGLLGALAIQPVAMWLAVAWLEGAVSAVPIAGVALSFLGLGWLFIGGGRKLRSPIPVHD
jgi:hypothetical protein